MSEWIECSDGLPEDETPVIININGEVRVGVICWEQPGWEDAYSPFQYWDDPYNEGQDWDWCDVTHWMPLPEPPEHT
ncbi:DUF551 domain-containing protein [Chimaeribacter arupi]|uniref:DUF551 domain-containing protein n=1 Tax=Chimaeribacter arupi TaxID=2060066 RepID=UPI0029482AD4|nr:DUF551 domain-containing protein [Chimaeribacter arupi]MDV5140811.1 DUF551 domain-containing protein [Chimaeribacter arupi]